MRDHPEPVERLAALERVLEEIADPGEVCTSYFEVLYGNEVRASLRRRLLEASGRLTGSPAALAGAAIRNVDPDPAILARARVILSGQDGDLALYASSCGSSSDAPDCGSVAAYLPLLGPRAIALVRPWIESADPERRRHAFEVVCQTVEDFGAGPYLVEALEVFYAVQGQRWDACLDTIRERAKLYPAHITIEEGAP